MIGIKVVMGDPSGTLDNLNNNTPDIQHDPFGIIGVLYNHDIHKIQFKLAKEFTNTNYSVIAAYLKKVKQNIKPNFMGLETNNRGNNILKLFREQYGMRYMYGVNTSADLTEETNQKGFTMDKNFMVKWFVEKREEGLFEFPLSPTKDMQKFIYQIPQIVAMKTLTGATSYKAQRGRHDDLFMAALHCCNFIRLFIDQQERLK